MMAFAVHHLPARLIRQQLTIMRIERARRHEREWIGIKLFMFLKSLLY